MPAIAVGMNPPPELLYLTTPIYYASGPPHIGHAYTTILGDAVARYERRMRGDDLVLFTTGTDEHGLKIQKAAGEARLPAEDFVGRIAQKYAAAWGALNVGKHEFVRTTSSLHKNLVRMVWHKLVAQGDIYLGEYEGLYCEGCEAFITEKDLTPGGLCPDHRTRPSKVREDSYFFRLSKYQDRLLALYDANPDFVTPASRLLEVRRRVEQGLSDLSISRTSCAWGIQVPDNPAHTVYVWFDALFSYASGAALGHMRSGIDPWPPATAGMFHLVGKEIVFFHAAYWPAFMMAVNEGADKPPAFFLPRRVVSHGWWTIEGEKMSKSRGNIVDPVKLANLVGADALRYFLLREIPVGEDGDFGRIRFLSRYNDELCNDLGNLLNRTLTMVEKFSGGVLRTQPPDDYPQPAPADEKLLSAIADALGSADDAMKRWQPSEALAALFALVRAGNAYLEEAAPFRLAKTAPDHAAYVLYKAACALYFLALALEPFIPERSAEILRQLGLDPSNCPVGPVFGCIPDGTQVRRGTVLFPRITEEQMVAAWREATAGGCAE